MRIAVNMLAVLLAGAGVVALAQNPPATRPSTQPAAIAPVNKFCPILPTDPVDPAVFVMHEGKKIAFCCADCIGEFRKEPAKYMATLK